MCGCWPACVSVHRLCAVPHRATDRCELPCGCRELNPDPLQEQPVLGTLSHLSSSWLQGLFYSSVWLLTLSAWWDLDSHKRQASVCACEITWIRFIEVERPTQLMAWLYEWGAGVRKRREGADPRGSPPCSLNPDAMWAAASSFCPRDCPTMMDCTLQLWARIKPCFWSGLSSSLSQQPDKELLHLPPSHSALNQSTPSPSWLGSSCCHGHQLFMPMSFRDHLHANDSE